MRVQSTWQKSKPVIFASLTLELIRPIWYSPKEAAHRGYGPFEGLSWRCRVHRSTKKSVVSLDLGTQKQKNAIFRANTFRRPVRIGQ